MDNTGLQNVANAPFMCVGRDRMRYLMRKIKKRMPPPPPSSSSLSPSLLLLPSKLTDCCRTHSYRYKSSQPFSDSSNPFIKIITLPICIGSQSLGNDFVNFPYDTFTSKPCAHNRWINTAGRTFSFAISFFFFVLLNSSSRAIEKRYQLDCKRWTIAKKKVIRWQ